MNAPTSPQRRHSLHSKWLLLLVTGATAAGWCVILPAVAERPQMKLHLQWLKEKHIDPSAMFYTELDVMDGILHKLEHRSQVEDEM